MPDCIQRTANKLCVCACENRRGIEKVVNRTERARSKGEGERERKKSSNFAYMKECTEENGRKFTNASEVEPFSADKYTKVAEAAK